MHHLGLGQLTRSLPGSVDEWGRRKWYACTLRCHVFYICCAWCMWVSPTRTAFWEVVAIRYVKGRYQNRSRGKWVCLSVKRVPFVAFKGKPKDSGSKDTSPMVGVVFFLRWLQLRAPAPPINFSKVMAFSPLPDGEKRPFGGLEALA